MSGLVSGITKVFTSLGTGAAALGNAVRGVGASLFTASAATGSSMASGGLSSLFGGGSSILGNMLSGALKTGLVGGLVGAGTSALTGGDWKKGAVIGGLGGAAAGGLAGAFTSAGSATGVDSITTGSTGGGTTAANTATGATGTGTSLANATGFGGAKGMRYGGTSAATTAGTSTGGGGGSSGGGTLFGGFGKYLQTDAGSNLIGNVLAGAGNAYSGWAQTEAYKEAQERQIAYLEKKQKDITEGYTVSDEALVGGDWAYNRETGEVEKKRKTA
jgi:hypothetical protein